MLLIFQKAINWANLQNVVGPITLLIANYIMEMLTLDKNIILVPTSPIPCDCHTICFFYYYYYLEGGLLRILEYHIKVSLCQNKLLFVHIPS